MKLESLVVYFDVSFLPSFRPRNQANSNLYLKDLPNFNALETINQFKTEFKRK